jgi:hypothetical protein
MFTKILVDAGSAYTLKTVQLAIFYEQGNKLFCSLKEKKFLSRPNTYQPPSKFLGSFFPLPNTLQTNLSALSGNETSSGPIPIP